MSPNPKLKLDLEGGPLKVAVISPDLELAIALRKAVKVRRDIVVVDSARGADVLVWDTGADGNNSPLTLRGVATLALAQHDGDAKRALAAGARSVVPRDVDLSSLIAAVIATRYGFSVRSLELEDRGISEAVDITEREKEVLDLLASGKGNRAIASALDISEHTIKFHVASLLSKLGAGTRTEAVVSAIRRGLIQV